MVESPIEKEIATIQKNYSDTPYLEAAYLRINQFVQSGILLI